MRVWKDLGQSILTCYKSIDTITILPEKKPWKPCTVNPYPLPAHQSILVSSLLASPFPNQLQSSMLPFPPHWLQISYLLAKSATSAPQVCIPINSSGCNTSPKRMAGPNLLVCRIIIIWFIAKRREKCYLLVRNWASGTFSLSPFPPLSLIPRLSSHWLPSTISIIHPLSLFPIPPFSVYRFWRDYPVLYFYLMFKE